jgi:vacuolar protein sorting-associated protein 13A/C
MMSKLGMKIVDNLQLKLVNLHVRFEENTPTKKYSWGVTLQEIVFVTTNSEWKPSFIDRSSE